MEWTNGFPGDKQDPNDVDYLDTAERDTFEEGKVEIINHLCILELWMIVR